ncbi:MAG: enoyl-ACP reductase [Chloroflexi bacterium]|nr:enoyl-ACP reductase [Chloroflexota bacterium]
MYTIDLTGKNALIFGVANQRSIAWAITQTLNQAGARIALSYQNERLRENVERLAPALSSAHPEPVEGSKSPLLVQCDVTREEDLASAFQKIKEQMGQLHMIVHSIAFAQREDLGGSFSKTTLEGFRAALDVSAYSLVAITRHAAPLMADGGSILTLTFLASERAFPGYNVMGTAKAALENEVRQLAYELGPRNIRVNAVSAGPLDTLSSRVIHGYTDMKRIAAERAPLKRNITHDEVARAALFLLSDLSSGVTGEVLHVDAGYNIMGI